MTEENKISEEEAMRKIKEMNDKRQKLVQTSFEKYFNSGSSDKILKAHELMMTENIAMNLARLTESVSNLNNNVVRIGQLLEKQGQKIITR